MKIQSGSSQHNVTTTDSVTVPIVFLNRGNQSEIIIESYLELIPVSPKFNFPANADTSDYAFIGILHLASIIKTVPFDANKTAMIQRKIEGFSIDRGEVKKIDYKIEAPLFTYDDSHSSHSLENGIILVQLKVVYLNEHGRSVQKNIRLGLIPVSEGQILFEAFTETVTQLF